MNRGPVYRIYPDDAGQWRWRLVAGNGRVIAACSEGYDRCGDAERAVATAAAAAMSAVVEVGTDVIEVTP